MTPDIMSRARRVRLLTCDVDGVLTDGRIYVDDDGREMKAFSALDGVGLNLLARGNVTVAWIEPLHPRCTRLSEGSMHTARSIPRSSSS